MKSWLPFVGIVLNKWPKAHEHIRYTPLDISFGATVECLLRSARRHLSYTTHTMDARRKKVKKKRTEEEEEALVIALLSGIHCSNFKLSALFKVTWVGMTILRKRTLFSWCMNVRQILCRLSFIALSQLFFILLMGSLFSQLVYKRMHMVQTW